MNRSGAANQLQGERGEIASWLVLAAALALIASLLGGILTPLFSDLARGTSGQSVATGGSSDVMAGDGAAPSGSDGAAREDPLTGDGAAGPDASAGGGANGADASDNDAAPVDGPGSGAGGVAGIDRGEDAPVDGGDAADDDVEEPPPPPPDRELSPWLEEALRQADIDWSEWDPDNGVDGNREIIEDVYTYYGELFLEDPDLQWAGMANMIGPSFAAGFLDLDMFGDLADAAAVAFSFNPRLASQFAELGANLTAEELQWYENKFLDMQRQIFLDQAPAHEAYGQEGIDAVDAMRESGEIDANLHEAWSLIDQGIQNDNQALIDAGNLMLLDREQRLIIEDDYQEMLNRPLTGQAMTYLMTLIGQPSVPGAQGFADVFPVVVTQEAGIGPEGACVFGRCIDNPLQGSVEIETPLPNGNIANLDDRWALIIEDTLPAYQDLLADPDRAREVVGAPVGERIDDGRLDVDSIVDVLTNFEIDFDQ